MKNDDSREKKNEKGKTIHQAKYLGFLVRFVFILSLHDMVMCLIKYNARNMWNTWYGGPIPVDGRCPLSGSKRVENFKKEK